MGRFYVSYELYGDGFLTGKKHPEEGYYKTRRTAWKACKSLAKRLKGKGCHFAVVNHDNVSGDNDGYYIVGRKEPPPEKPAKMIAYVAHPYRAKTIDEIAENIWDSRRVAKKYWKQGYAVICPCLNSAFMDGEIKDKDFIEGDLVLLSYADLLVLSGDWKKSTGCMAEREFAKVHGMPILDDNLSKEEK